MTKTVKVAEDRDLLTLDYIDALSNAIVGLHLSRRKTPDWLASVLFGWIEQGGVVLDPSGCVIDLHPEIVDDAHGNDGSFRCISDITRRIVHPSTRRPKRSLLLRLRLYDAAFKIIGEPLTRSG